MLLAVHTGSRIFGIIVPTVAVAVTLMVLERTGHGHHGFILIHDFHDSGKSVTVL